MLMTECISIVNKQVATPPSRELHQHAEISHNSVCFLPRAPASPLTSRRCRGSRADLILWPVEGEARQLAADAGRLLVAVQLEASQRRVDPVVEPLTVVSLLPVAQYCLPLVPVVAQLVVVAFLVAARAT